MNEPTTFWGILREILPYLALLFSGYGIYLASKKQPFDITKLSAESENEMAEVAKKYKEMVSNAADVELKLRTEIQTVRERLEEIKTRHDQELEEIKAVLERAEQRAAKLEDWAHRLVAQVESLGEVPVPFELKPRNPTIPRKEK